MNLNDPELLEPTRPPVVVSQFQPKSLACRNAKHELCKHTPYCSCPCHTELGQKLLTEAPQEERGGCRDGLHGFKCFLLDCPCACHVEDARRLCHEESR